MSCSGLNDSAGRTGRAPRWTARRGASRSWPNRAKRSVWAMTTVPRSPAPMPITGSIAIYQAQEVRALSGRSSAHCAYPRLHQRTTSAPKRVRARGADCARLVAGRGARRATTPRIDAGPPRRSQRGPKTAATASSVSERRLLSVRRACRRSSRSHRCTVRTTAPLLYASVGIIACSFTSASFGNICSVASRA
jgi:hypothetical protein